MENNFCRKCRQEIHPDNNFCGKCLDSAPEIELSNLDKWLRHLDTCNLNLKGKCPNQCAEGKYLVCRTLNVTAKGN